MLVSVALQCLGTFFLFKVIRYQCAAEQELLKHHSMFCSLTEILSYVVRLTTQLLSSAYVLLCVDCAWSD